MFPYHRKLNFKIGLIDVAFFKQLKLWAVLKDLKKQFYFKFQLKISLELAQ